MDSSGILRFMKTQTTFRSYSPGQLLLPPDMARWLSEDYLVYFIRDVVGQMNPKGVIRPITLRRW